tara:strand:- start:26182 stop:26898 length:717 start_codon:yes stop_codon:yes gene_type:complete
MWRILMKENPIDVRQAIADVALLRRVLNQIEERNIDKDSSGLFGTTLKTNMLLQIVALVSALIIGFIEIFSGDAIFRSLSLAHELSDVRLIGISVMALMITGIMIGLYFVLWRASQKSGEEFGAYIKRNFRYSRQVSYLSDLLMKFFAVGLLLLANQSQWIAPLLIAFTGDYLLQGRLFTLSTKLAVVLGVGCIAGAILQFLLQSSSLIPPVTIFSIITIISIVRLMKLKQRQNKLTI